MGTIFEGQETSTTQCNSEEQTERQQSLCGQEEKGCQKSSLGTKWLSWSFVWLLYSVLVSSLVRLAHANIFTSPLLDEIIRDAESTPWVDGFDSCLYQSLIAPSVLISSAIGSLLAMFLSHVLGLVPSIVVSTVISAVGWAMIGASWLVSSPVLFRTLLLTGRFVTGLILGSFGTLHPVYVGELSPSSKYRVVFVGFGFLVYAAGSAMTYALGAFISYWICAFIYSGMMTALIPFQLFIQESPLRTRNIIKNAKSLLVAMKNLKDGVSHKSEFGPFVKRLVLVNAVFVSHVFMGYTVLLQYVGPILNVAGASEWNIPHGVLIALTVGGGDFLGAMLSMFISPRLNHVVSAFIGAVGVCIGHIGIAVYFILVGELSRQPAETIITQNTSNHSSLGLICFFEPTIDGDLGQQYSPIALIGIAIVMVMYGTFWMMQPYVILVELFPNGANRDLGVGITLMARSILQVVLSFLFPILDSAIGTAPSFFLFAANAILAAILIPCIVPETKGRPMGERGDKFTPKQNLIEFFDSLSSLCCFWKQKNL